MNEAYSHDSSKSDVCMISKFEESQQSHYHQSHEKWIFRQEKVGTRPSLTKLCARAPVCIVFLGRFSVVQKPSAYQDITLVQVWRICISSRYCSFEELWYTRTGVFDTHCFNILVWGNFKLSSEEPQKNCVSCSTFNGSYPGSKSEVPITNIPHRYQIYTSSHI